MDINKKHGGARAGAGRRREGNNRVKMNFMLLPEVAAYIRSRGRPSEVIEKIILNNMKSS